MHPGPVLLLLSHFSIPTFFKEHAEVLHEAVEADEPSRQFRIEFFDRTALGNTCVELRSAGDGTESYL